MIDRIKKRHIALLVLLSALALVITFYLQDDTKNLNNYIRSYNHENDFLSVRKIINDNKFWLSENPDFSAEKMLTYRAPPHAPEKKGDAKVDVLESEKKVAGFIAYYLKNSSHGKIWLLGVEKEYRGQGFGTKLMEHALKRLKDLKVKYVTIAVRSINDKAIALYKKVGFKESENYKERGMLVLRLNFF